MAVGRFSRCQLVAGYIFTESEVGITSHVGFGLNRMALNERINLAADAELVSPLTSWSGSCPVGRCGSPPRRSARGPAFEGPIGQTHFFNIMIPFPARSESKVAARRDDSKCAGSLDDAVVRIAVVQSRFDPPC